SQKVSQSIPFRTTARTTAAISRTIRWPKEPIGACDSGTSPSAGSRRPRLQPQRGVSSSELQPAEQARITLHGILPLDGQRERLAAANQDHQFPAPRDARVQQVALQQQIVLR